LTPSIEREEDNLACKKNLAPAIDPKGDFIIIIIIIILSILCLLI